MCTVEYQIVFNGQLRGLLPLVALVPSGWLIYESMMEKGPEIRVTFPSADGLEVDKTKIEFRDVQIGKVTVITLIDDLQAIQVTVEMDRAAADYLIENTLFWVVRPNIGLSGVSGLGTLLSGPYIEVDPGDGPRRKNFTGLATSPVLKSDKAGQHYMLETKNIGGIHPGTPMQSGHKSGCDHR